MWPCPKCAEAIEDTLAVCWNCGTGQDGKEDETFEREGTIVTSEENTPLASRAVHTGYRVFAVAGAGAVSMICPLIFNEQFRAQLEQLRAQLEFSDEVGVTDWIANLAFALLIGPILTFLWIVLARVFGTRLEWSHPSWSQNPLDFTRPLELLHLLMWMHLVGGLGGLIVLPVAGSFWLIHPISCFAGAWSLSVTSKYLLKTRGRPADCTPAAEPPLAAPVVSCLNAPSYDTRLRPY